MRIECVSLRNLSIYGFPSVRHFIVFFFKKKHIATKYNRKFRNETPTFTAFASCGFQYPPEMKFAICHLLGLSLLILFFFLQHFYFCLFCCCCVARGFFSYFSHSHLLFQIELLYGHNF